MTEIDLCERLRAWGRRYEPMSQERRLFNQAADYITALHAAIDAEVAQKLTVDAVEQAIGGKLLTWQKKALDARGDDAA
jgi:hypothetical protein